MVVAAYNLSGSQQVGLATTDSNGNYALTLPAGTYRLLAYDNALVYATTYAGDAASFETSTPLVLTTDVTGVNFALRRGGTIAGSVASAATGAPLSGIVVAAYDSGSGARRNFTQTDSNGHYSILLPPGTYRLASYDNNGVYAVRFFDDQPAFETAADIAVVASQNRNSTNFRLPLAAHVSGKVVDADTSQPLSGRLVIAYSTDGSQVASTNTDVSGSFAFTFAAADYKFVAVDTTRVYAAGYVADASAFANDPVVSPQPGQTITSVEIPLHRAGVVSGVVSDASGAPLGGITVAAYNGDGTQRTTAQTDAGGAYSLLLPPGTFRVAAFDSSLVYATEFYPDRFLFSDGTPITLVAGVATTAVNLSLVRGGRVRGTITDQQSGAAIAGITVAAYDDSGNVISSGVSSSDGKYALVAPPGDYRLAAFDSQLRYVTAYSGGAANFESASWTSVATDSTNDLNFALAQGLRLSGKVIDSTNVFVSVSNVQVGALDAMGNRVAGAVTVDGSFNLMLAPGTYRILVTDPLDRYHASFYNGAVTLASATPVVVSANGPPPITIFLSRLIRRRAAPHA